MYYVCIYFNTHTYNVNENVNVEEKEHNLIVYIFQTDIFLALPAAAQFVYLICIPCIEYNIVCVNLFGIHRASYTNTQIYMYLHIHNDI